MEKNLSKYIYIIFKKPKCSKFVILCVNGFKIERRRTKNQVMFFNFFLCDMKYNNTKS